MSLTNVVRNNVIDAVNGVDTFDAPTTPMMIRLMTANGDATTAGTELGTGAGGGTGAGYTAGGKVVTPASAAGGSTSPTATLLWDNMPACTIVGAEIWDSAGTPKRWQFAALTAPRVLASGDSFEIPTANYTNTLN